MTAVQWELIRVDRTVASMAACLVECLGRGKALMKAV